MAKPTFKEWKPQITKTPAPLPNQAPKKTGPGKPKG